MQKAIISDLVKIFQIDINILQANIEHIHQETIGIMIVIVSGEEMQIRKMLAYLQQEQISYDVIKSSA